jgi:nicotinate phosphoribosyltransferase
MINSILDTDLYKLSMQNFVLHKYPDANVTYKFNNRNKEMKFDNVFLAQLGKAIFEMSHIQLTDEEEKFLREKCPYLGESYIQYLKNYRFNPKEVEYYLDKDHNLEITITGPWHTTILWEVPLMAVISELYFKYCDKDWTYSNEQQFDLATYKAAHLSGENCVYADFGTRRRRSYDIQCIVVNAMSMMKGTFIGTSNVHVAHKLGLKPIGTMAHELIMGISALEGLRHANRFALEKWAEFYNGNLGVALTDTFGTDAFFDDFNLALAKQYDVRHDSGSPTVFADKIVSKYKQLGIDPTTKTIVFSDGLDVSEAVKIRKHCEGKIRCAFGIGTNFTNDFKKATNGLTSKPLNMVIKLASVNDIPVVKISDSPTKAIGDKDALRVAMWTFFKKPLDA